MKHSEPAAPSEPPKPPPFQRRIQIGWLQVSGVALLLLLPIAALTGWIGSEERETSATGAQLALTARYPSRMRYKTSEAIELRLRNTGAHTLSGVTVLLPQDYLSHFAVQHLRPQIERLSERGAEVDIGDLDSGQSRSIVVELQVTDYGRHAGRISAVADGGTPVALDVSTLVLP